MNAGKTLFSQLMDFLYLLVAIAKKELRIDRSLGEILQIPSHNVDRKRRRTDN